MKDNERSLAVQKIPNRVLEAAQQIASSMERATVLRGVNGKAIICQDEGMILIPIGEEEAEAFFNQTPEK